MDVKFEYLAFCLKLKEMEDEETMLIEDGNYLPRFDNGNMEYRYAVFFGVLFLTFFF